MRRVPRKFPNIFSHFFIKAVFLHAFPDIAWFSLQPTDDFFTEINRFLYLFWIPLYLRWNRESCRRMTMNLKDAMQLSHWGTCLVGSSETERWHSCIYCTGSNEIKKCVSHPSRILMKHIRTQRLNPVNISCLLQNRLVTIKSTFAWSIYFRQFNIYTCEPELLV